MLVTLGTNTTLAAGASTTFPYACRSVQKVFIKVDDSSGNNALEHTCTIQLGQRTIANGVSAFGLFGMSTLQSDSYASVTEVYYQIDLGSHQLLDNENLYVSVRNSGSGSIDAVDVSALVDQPEGGEMPVRYTEYSDNVFTAENVLCSMSYASDTSVVDEDGANVEIRNSVNSSSPTFISCNNWYGSTAISNGWKGHFGLLVKEALPLTTTFNYTSTDTDRILVASQMGTNARAIRQGRNQQRIAQSQVGR